MKLKEFLNTSEFFRPEGSLGFFTGNFYPDLDNMMLLKCHYLKTGENLLNVYVKCVWDSWLESDHPFILFEDELSKRIAGFNKVRSVINFPDDFIKRVEDSLSMYSKTLDRYRKSIDKTPRRIATRFTCSREVRKAIFSKFGEICLCCGATENLTIDHIKPVKLGGKNSLRNLQPLCRSCNSKKGTKIIDYRKKKAS